MPRVSVVIPTYNRPSFLSEATGNTVTVNELAELVVKITGKDLEPVYQESRTGDISHSLADISQAKAFGYTPRYSLEEGLKETTKHLLQ